MSIPKISHPQPTVAGTMQLPIERPKPGRHRVTATTADKDRAERLVAAYKAARR